MRILWLVSPDYHEVAAIEQDGRISTLDIDELVKALCEPHSDRIEFRSSWGESNLIRDNSFYTIWNLSSSCRKDALEAFEDLWQNAE